MNDEARKAAMKRVVEGVIKVHPENKPFRDAVKKSIPKELPSGRLISEPVPPLKEEK